jgi:hemolysin activation/secretion protein
LSIKSNLKFCPHSSVNRNIVIFNFNKKQVRASLSWRRILRHKGLRRLSLSVGLTALFASSVAAQPAQAEAAARAGEIQRRQEQELEAQRARAAQRPDVLSAPEAPAAGEGPLVFPQETPCFALRDVLWDGPEPPAELRRVAAGAIGPCVGGQGLKALQRSICTPA